MSTQTTTGAGRTAPSGNDNPPSISQSPLVTFNDGLPLPGLIVFDLDYTLWPFWADTHLTPPLRASLDGGVSVQDAGGDSFAFYKDTPTILAAIRNKNIPIGAASRTAAPPLARQMLELLTISTADGASTPAIQCFDHLEIYPGTKTTHFKKLHKAIGVDYSDMLFFDDERRNKNVEELGVTMWLVPRGVSLSEFDNGVLAWRKRRGVSKPSG